MYDELVKALRETDFGDVCVLCDSELCRGKDCVIIQAADAIEELSKERDKWKATAKEERDAYWHWFDQYQKDVPKWIPVTERLPDGRYSVLALTGDCDIYVCDYIPSVKQFWTIPGDELHIDDITHWMPLPEPPAEE